MKRGRADAQTAQMEIEEMPTLARLRYSEHSKHSSQGSRWTAQVEYCAKASSYDCAVLDGGKVVKRKLIERYSDVYSWLLSDGVKEVIPAHGGWIFTKVEPASAW